MSITNFADNWYSGAGDVFIGLKNTTNGLAKSMFSLGNLPKVEVKLNIERRKHKDSRGANRLIDKVQTQTKGGEINLTLEDIARKIMGVYLSGNEVSIGSGSYATSSYDVCPDSAMA